MAGFTSLRLTASPVAAVLAFGLGFYRDTLPLTAAHSF